jgi:hypothetical protein
MNTFFIIIAVAAGGWVLLMLGLKGMAALLRRSTVKATKNALAGENILKMTDNVSFLGADFSGPNLPPRTSGVLAVTDSRIIFLPWFPRRAIKLPRDTIAEVNLQDHYDEMAYNIPVLLLKIRGVGDPHGSMAWLTHEPEEWERVIKSILN